MWRLIGPIRRHIGRKKATWKPIWRLIPNMAPHWPIWRLIGSIWRHIVTQYGAVLDEYGAIFAQYGALLFNMAPHLDHMAPYFLIRRLIANMAPYWFQIWRLIQKAT